MLERLGVQWRGGMPSRKRGIWLQLVDRAFHSSLIESVVRVEYPRPGI